MPRSRKLGRSVLLVSLAAAALARAEPSFAEEPRTSGDTNLERRQAKAKAKYQQGVEAYSADSYADAVELFLEADRLAPSAPLSFNVARSYQNLGDEAGALRWYRDYLRRDPKAKNAEDVRDTIATLATSLIKRGVQQLSVLSDPAGATVSIDGRPLGVAPWTGEIAPGKHHVMLTLRGYVDVQRDIALPAGEPIDVTLPMQKSELVAAAPAQGGEGARGPELGPLPWLALGVGAVSLGGALTFEIMRRSAESDARGAASQLSYQSALETEQSRRDAARVLLGVGGAFVVAGGVLLLIDSRSGSDAPALSAGFVCLPETCAVAARGRF